MTEVHDLRRLYYDEGKNITEIAKQTGRDRKTVRESLHKEDWNEPQINKRWFDEKYVRYFSIELI